jgi:hypothetical protein
MWDRLWTNLLESREMTAADMELVAEVGEALRRSWTLLTEEWVLKEEGEWLISHREVINQGIAEVHGAEGADGRERWMTADAAIGAIEALRRYRGPELENLHTKIGALRGGEWVAGDLATKSLCAILLVSIGAAYSRGQAAVAAFLEGWFLQAGCPELLTT